MPKFDPKGKAPRPDAVPPGLYNAGAAYFQRKRSKGNNGKPAQDYISIKWVICDGAQKGMSFFEALFVDLSKPGNATRWRIICEALGIEEEFEIGSTEEGNTEEGDDNIRRLILGRGLKMKVDRETQGTFTNNKIAQFIFPRMYSDADRAAIAAWESEYRKRRNEFDPPDESGDSSGPSYDDFDNRSAPDDDEIPF